MAVSGNDEAQVESGASAEGLGARLRNAREAQKLTIERLADELRISKEALRALEQSQMDLLGPPVFAKGYLKQYAARLGLDVQQASADLNLLLGNASIDIAPSRSLGLRDERKLPGRVVAGVIVALLVGVALYWWFSQPDPMASVYSLFD